MKRTNTFISLILLFSSFVTSAEVLPSITDKCNPSKLEKIKYSQCLDLMKIKVDRELETWVNNQLFILEGEVKATGRESAFEMFKRAQKNFTTFRDNNCKWQFLSKLPSNKADVTYKECYISISINRIDELTRINK